MSRNFNENSRVKFPALVHLCSIGYRYLSLKNMEYDVNTNILTDVLRYKIKEFNPEKTDIEISQFIAKISNVLENDDLGREFYELLTSVSDFKLINFSEPDTNDFICTTEFTCKNGDDEFRPDITLLVNGSPIAFIEVKKPNNKEGVLANAVRTFGDDELKEKFAEIGIEKINDLFREAAWRLDTINLKLSFEHQDEVSGIINEAMATITFSFHKVGEEELRIVGEDYEQEFQAVMREFVKNFDTDGEDYTTLTQAFKEYFKKRGLEPNDVAEAKEAIGYMQEVMTKIREINRRNANLQQMYNGDEKFARIHKRTFERRLISQRETEVCEVLNKLKSSVGHTVLLNSAILQNDPYFEGQVKVLVGSGLNELSVKAAVKDKLYISELIAQQYLNQYHTGIPARR